MDYPTSVDWSETICQRPRFDLRAIRLWEACSAACISLASANRRNTEGTRSSAVDALSTVSGRSVESGVASKEDIDTAMKGGCGFPMGPFALLDLVGLDTSLSILEALYEEFKDPNYAPRPTLKRLVAAGQLGRKSGKGFYDYGKK